MPPQLTTRGGVIGSTFEIAGGWKLMIDEIRDACVAPEKALLPVAISYSTAPKEKMSLLASAG